MWIDYFFFGPFFSHGGRFFSSFFGGGFGAGGIVFLRMRWIVWMTIKSSDPQSGP